MAELIWTPEALSPANALLPKVRMNAAAVINVFISFLPVVKRLLRIKWALRSPEGSINERSLMRSHASMFVGVWILDTWHYYFYQLTIDYQVLLWIKFLIMKWARSGIFRMLQFAIISCRFLDLCGRFVFRSRWAVTQFSWSASWGILYWSRPWLWRSRPGQRQKWSRHSSYVASAAVLMANTSETWHVPNARSGKAATTKFQYAVSVGLWRILLLVILM